MKSIFTALIGCACISLFCFSTCSKEDKKDSEPQSKITSKDLMGEYGRSWTISQVEKTYMNVSGGTDSVAKRDFQSLDERMYFSKNFGYSDEKEVYSCYYPLNEYIPQDGAWTLDSDNQKLSFACYGIGINCTTDKNGTWDISDFGKSAYGTSFNMERIFSYSDGRKLKVKARIYTDTY